MMGDKTMKKHITLKKIILPIVLLVFGSFMGMLLLVLTYQIPVERMHKHIKESVYVFNHEDAAYYFAGNATDLNSDSFQLLAAGNGIDGNAWKNAANIWIPQMNGKSPAELVCTIYRQEIPVDSYGTSYARYWHGYLILLKPLLLIFNYMELRYLMIAVEITLFLLDGVLLFQKYGMQYVFAFLTFYLFLNPLVVASSLNYSTDIILAFGGTTVVMVGFHFWQKHAYAICLLFMALGMVTSYMDLLTAPCLTLCIPLITFLTGQWIYYDEIDCADMRQCGHKDGVFIYISSLIGGIVGWAFGYIGMWAGKLVIGSCIVGRNLWTEAVATAKWRMSNFSDNIVLTTKQVIDSNISEISIVFWFLFVAIIFLVILSGSFSTHSIHRYGVKIDMMYVFSMILMIMVPFLWYNVAKNHSYQHCWFTYRELGITIYAIVLLAIYIGNYRKRYKHDDY